MRVTTFLTLKDFFMRKNLLLAVMLSACCFPAFTQTSPQIRTATFLNNLNQFQDVFGNQNYPRSATAEDVAADDDIYACSKKLQGVSDSATPFNLARSVSSLALQGFGFTIPDDATIENISVRLRRFKNGRPSIGDHTLSVMQRYQCSVGIPCRYGKHWTYLDDYTGKIYPDTETEYSFSQSGSGNDGGFNHNEAYQWTPAMVNAVTFGVRIDNYVPIGRGTVSVCYDLVEVTVHYSQLLTIAGKSQVATEAKTLKKPLLYPNPASEFVMLHFNSIEEGPANVQILNTAGQLIKQSDINVTKGYIQVKIAVHEIKQGMYLLRINKGELNMIRKFVIAR